MIELQENNYLSKYDKLFIANWEGFTCLVYSNLKKINKKLELSWFEDGFGTYSFDGQFFLKPNLKTRIINRIKGNYSLYNEVKSLNLFNPKLLVWKINKPLEINTIKSPNDECKKFLNEIFEYNNLKDTYKEKFIFFQDGYKDFEDTTDIEMLEIIAKEVGKENIFIKRHPRDTSNKFKNKGFKTNIDTKIPSELIILNNDFSNSIFITFYSQSIITSSQLFGKKIKSIILSNINNKNNNDEYYKYLYEYIYKKDNKNYILPKTKEELINILRSI